MIALYAGAGLCAYNLLVTALTLAEARGQIWTATILGTITGTVSLTISTLVVTALQGHDTTTKALVYLAIVLGNAVGTWAGMRIGRRWIGGARALRRKYDPS